LVQALTEAYFVVRHRDMASAGLLGRSAPAAVARHLRRKVGRSAVLTRAVFIVALAALLLQAVAVRSSTCFAVQTPMRAIRGVAASSASKQVGEQLHKVTGRSVKVSQAALPEAVEAVLEVVNSVPEQVASFGPMGAVYFFVAYVIAECIALPATPLTLSAGYLFGLPQGIALTVLAGSTAAAIAFTLSRTFLRPQIEKLAAGNEQFVRINKAVEKEGFKIIALLRLSPLLPFSISNYIFGLSSASFSDFIAATLIGFTPGTAALIILSSSMREVAMAEGGASQPWYIYAMAITLSFCLLKLATDIAKAAVDEAVDDTEQAVVQEPDFLKLSR